MKKRDRPKSGGGRAPRPAAPKRTSSQTFAADQAEAPSTPFAYAFLKGQNRNLWQSHAQYKREARSERKARERAEKESAASNERARRFDAAFRSLDVDLAATLRAIGEAPMDISGDDPESMAKRCQAAAAALTKCWAAVSKKLPAGDAAKLQKALQAAEQAASANEQRAAEASANVERLESAVADLRKQRDAAQKRADDVEREREITPEEVRQAKKAEADEARARGDSDVREAKRAKTEPAASDPDAQKALDVQKKRVAQLEDQLGTATEEKLFAKSAADAATTAHAALLAQKARAVATARSEDPETRAKALRLEGELRTATAKLDAAVAKRDAAQKRADGCLARLAAAEALGRDAAAKGLADWQTRLDAARTARKKSEAACKQATDASRALEAACAALRGAAQTAHQLVEEERRLRKGAEDQVKRLAARAQAAAKPEEGEASEDARGVDELRSALADAEAMNAALLEDVDATAVALDELRAQNASLIEGSSAHDAAWRASLQQATTQQAECRQAAAERDAVQKQLDATRYVIAEMKALVEAKDGRTTTLESNGEDAARRLEAREAEVVELKGIAEGAEMRAAAATKDRDAMKARLETVDGDLSGRLADAERRVLGEKERAGRAERQNTKLQGALDAAQRDVKRLRAHAAQAGDDIDKSLLREAQAKLRCSVCDDREKTTCLIRCMHTFCRECVQKNIDNRSRKCPACGERFGKDDVKDIYLVT